MKTPLQCILYPLILVIALLVWSCAQQPAGPVYVRNGKEYGKTSGVFFRHKWWNYYERALSYADGTFYQKAITDLEKAIEQRQQDQRMARTYGMHFIDYFPHRELGVIHYQTGSFEDAKRELEFSLTQFPSAKARFYLDRVRKALIEQEVREVSPPRLTVRFDTREVWTRGDPVLISGVAEDEHYVAEITINGVPLFLKSSERSVPFEYSFDLSQGRHQIEVAAKNLVGGVAEQIVLVHVDREGPIVSIDELQVDRTVSPHELNISGAIYDEAGVSRLSIAEQGVSIREGVEVAFSFTFQSVSESLKLVASDRLGNQTSAEISLAEVSSKDKPLLLACAHAGGGHLVAEFFAPADTRPPDIRLRGWTDTQTVFLEKVYIEGHASDEGRIENLTINQNPILRRPGRQIFFNHLAELEVGENTLSIEARDEEGNTARKSITIIRNVPKALQLAERLSLTALPFERKGEVAGASLAFQDNLLGALVNQNRFQVIEREKLYLILQEQEISLTELIDRRTAIKVGRLAAAKCIVTGSIIESRIGVEVVARMIDTETAEILSNADVYGEGKDLPSLRTLAEGMAIEFHRDFPLVDGLVLERKGEHIFTDLGDDMIKLRRRLIVYRESPMKHPVTGKEIGSDNEIVGHARITQVMPQMSKAALYRGEPADISTLDKVIAE